MIGRYSYGQGSRLEREVEQPVSLMEVCMADSRMPCTCPDCGIVHDGLHGHGLLKVNAVCADCYELRRGKGIKRAAGYKREIARLREGYRRILELDDYEYYRKDMAREIAMRMLEGGGE